jgi:hypothetical protein
VFWFGNEAAPTPARPDGRDGPISGSDMIPAADRPARSAWPLRAPSLPDCRRPTPSAL